MTDLTDGGPWMICVRKPGYGLVRMASATSFDEASHTLHEFQSVCPDKYKLIFRQPVIDMRHPWIYRGEPLS